MSNFFISYVRLILFCLILFFFNGCQQNNTKHLQLGSELNRENIIIGVIHVDLAESGYSYAHDYGIREAQRELGLRDDQIIRKFNVVDIDGILVEAVIRETIIEGANIIFATSWGHMEVCEKLAEIYPEVVFAHASGYRYNDTNFTNYFGRIYLARYLSGVAAGMHTKTNKIGFVAAQDIANSEVTGGLNAFAIGVEKVNPEAEIIVVVTHSWFDPPGERHAAQRLIAEGCDVIAQHSNTPVAQIEAELSGVWGIGYNTDMRREAPNAVLTSVVWHWGVYYTYLINSVLDGSFKTEPYFAGLKEGLVDITPLHEDLVTPEMEYAVSQARERILDGFNVFEGLMETNDAQIVGREGESLTDEEITSGINWYYRNVSLLR
ncbi:MAG: BMP family ABC transporter substrate-binding protein [Candidatus Cloacimonetes bacterium]|nr:BMP family ABC transporter substrate-binding protein [Candidatus Cloacimonadota bacterium]